jgi:hypothetical protein
MISLSQTWYGSAVSPGSARQGSDRRWWSYQSRSAVAENDTGNGMNSSDRHVYGPQPIAALLPRLTRPAFRRRAPATAQVLADWAEIIGPAIAAVTTPRRLASGTLTIACAGPIAMELQHLANEVMGRINAHLGCQLVTALRFVQTAVHAPPYGAPAARPDPEQLAMVEATLSNLPEGDLRTALAALGRAIATPKQHRR